MNDEEAQNELFESESIQFEKKEEVVALVLEEEEVEEEKKGEYIISEIILNKYKKEDEEGEPVEMIQIEDSKEILSNGKHNNINELKEETSIEITKPIQKQSILYSYILIKIDTYYY